MESLASSLSSLTSQSEYDFEKENSSILNYYETKKSWLQTLILHELPLKIRENVAVMHERTLCSYEWIKIAEDLGLNSLEIEDISYKSKCGAQPLKFVFTRAQNVNVFYLIESLITQEKFHILKYLKAFFKSFESSCHKEKCSSPTLVHAAELQHSTVSKNNCPSTAPQNSLKSHLISVFILHAMSDSEVARKVGVSLRKQGLAVILSADIQDVLRINHVQILGKLHEMMDFIVPVVSQSFMTQIKSPNGNLEGRSNRYFYHLLLHEYSVRCLNCRVRPVALPSEVVHLTAVDSILLWNFKLWDEIPALVRHLKRSFKKQSLR